MFMVWQRAVGGRIKSDIRFNKLLSWNTFPLPTLTDASRAAVVAAGKGVLAARTALGAGVPLAAMYPPDGLDPGLQAAHDTLDHAVDAAFGLRQSHGTAELQRLDILFDRYRELTARLRTDRSRRSGRRTKGAAR
jgi:hypothetical protein